MIVINIRMNKYLSLVIPMLVFGFTCSAQLQADSTKALAAAPPGDSLVVPRTYSDAYLDTVRINRVF